MAEDISAEELTEDVEEALRRQDDALALLERLRAEEPRAARAGDHPDGRREGRRWPAPDGVAVEAHDGRQWHALSFKDLGIGGGQVGELPAWIVGPTPVRLRGLSGPAVLALTDMMWRGGTSGGAGLRFEFLDPEERDRWAATLIDALLARYALG